MEDLNSIGCLGFVDKPWGFKEESIVKELLGKLSNEFDNTPRAVPHLWTEDMWRTAYSFCIGGLGMASRKDEFCCGKFEGAVNRKDEYTVDDYIDEWQRRLLKFLVPVLHPEKPTRVTISLANTIFGSVRRDWKVD